MTARLAALAAFATATLAAAYVIDVGGVLAGALLAGASLTARLPTNPLAPADPLVIGCTLGALIVEAVVLGWRESSLRRVALGSDRSVRTDAMYTLIWASGLMTALGAVMTLGTASAVQGIIERWVGLGVFVSAPLSLAVPCGLIWMSFTSYWQHRLGHSRWLWPLHKSHHAPTSFAVLTVFRAHPIEATLSTIMDGVAFGVIGFSAEAMMLTVLISGVWPLFIHSNILSLGRLESLGVCTPNGHLVHHSVDPRHHNTNFGGLVNVWDRLFGTYVVPPADVAALAIGVDDSARVHNTERPFRAIWIQTMLWIDQVRQESRPAERALPFNRLRPRSPSTALRAASARREAAAL